MLTNKVPHTDPTWKKQAKQTAGSSYFNIQPKDSWVGNKRNKVFTVSFKGWKLSHVVEQEDPDAGAEAGHSEEHNYLLRNSGSYGSQGTLGS